MKKLLPKVKSGGLLGLAFLMLFTVLMPIISERAAQAQGGGAGAAAGAAGANPRFIDRLYIQYDGDTWGNPNPYNEGGSIINDAFGGFTYFRDWKWQDGLGALAPVATGEECTDYIRVNDIYGTPKADVFLREDDARGDCQVVGGGRGLSMENTGVKLVNAYRIDADNIFAPAGVTDVDIGCSPDSYNAWDTFIDTQTNFRRFRNNGGDLTGPPNEYEKVQRNGELNPEVTLETGGGSSADIVVQIKVCVGRDEERIEDVVLRNNGNAVTGDPGDCIPRIESPPDKACGDDDPSDPTDPGGGPGDDADAPPSCEEVNPGISLSWFICSVINFLDDTIAGLNSAVIQLLVINKDYYTDSGLREAWAYFRNIASFLLIIIGLVMIIGQAVTKG
jgi:hypothetical protein